MTTESAPNWDQGQGLTWSGKWHIIVPGKRARIAGLLTLCGAYVYDRDESRTIDHLSEIATGQRKAPVCKRCQRAQAKREDSQR